MEHCFLHKDIKNIAANDLFIIQSIAALQVVDEYITLDLRMQT